MMVAGDSQNRREKGGAMINAHLLILQVSDKADIQDWWTQLMFGEPRGIDWLYLLGGVLFFSFVGYGIYSAMLYNQIGGNRHPANFRKLMVAFVLLFSIIWFAYVFSQVFGGVMLGILLTVWLIYLIVFLITRRKVSTSQA